MTRTTHNSNRRRRGLFVLAVAATAATLLGVSTTAANASSKPASTSSKDSTNLRDCYHPKKPAPGTSCTVKATLSPNTPITLICQYQGENISGDVWWDYVLTPNNGYGYVSDYYLNTGSQSYRVPGVDLCNY